MRTVGLWAVAVAVAIVVPTEASAGAAKRRCDVRGAVTIQADAMAVVFTKRGRLYGCTYRAGRPLLLGTNRLGGCGGGCEGIVRVELAGRHLAYASVASSRGFAVGSAHTVDLVRRIRRTNWNGTQREGGVAVVSAVAVTGTGHTAWITTTGSSAEGAYLDEVHVERGQGDQIVDSGRDTIVRGSLTAASSGAFFWLNGDQARVAR